MVQHILVNQYLTLEDVLAEVSDGDSVELILRARRQIQFEERAGVGSVDAGGDSAVRRLTVHRDDAALAAFYRRSADAVLAAAQADPTRERRVLELCTARNQLAAPALTELGRHSDLSVADRARQALAAL